MEDVTRRRARAAMLRVDGLMVQVRRKPIKNLYLRVRPPEGAVEVSAPMGMPDARIAAFVRDRGEWIARQQRRLEGMPPSGGGAAQWDEEKRRQAARAIEAALPGLLARWEPVVGRRPTHITLRLMTSRWGSCTPRTGRIRLNLQLGLMEPRFLEYVLVHEMTHLWESGHGAGFQRRMDGYLPGWRTLRRELNRQLIG